MKTTGFRAPPRWRPLLPFAGIALVVGGLAGAFAWTAGWLSPARITAPRLVDTIENGRPYPGFRRAHARGVCVAGWFEPTPDAARLSRARVFSQARTPAIGRLSIGGADPLGAHHRREQRFLVAESDPGQRKAHALCRLRDRLDVRGAIDPGFHHSMMRLKLR